MAHDALDGRIVDDELAVIAEDRPHNGLLAEAAAPRRGALEERLQRIDEIAGEMRLELDRRHRDDVLALLDTVEARLLHLRPRRDVLDADDLRDGRQAQGLRDLLDHVLRGAEDQDAVRLRVLDGLAHLLCMTRQYKDSPANGHDLVLLLLGRVTRQDLAVLDEDAIIDDGIGTILMRDNQRAMTLSGPTRTD